MARYYLIIFMLVPLSSWAEKGLTQAITDSIVDIKAAVEDLNKSYEQCEALYDEIRNTRCANTVISILGRMYLKIGVSMVEHQLQFQNAKSSEDVFMLSSGSKPRPIYSIILKDSYFKGSNWGYGFGFDYFDDYAFKQIVQRGGGSNNQSFDLGTSSSMTVMSVTPNVFYTLGRGDSTPYRYIKLGGGLNLMHSDVRGTAYETELDTPENGACYSAATDIFNGAVGDPLSISSSCDLRRFSESSYGFGAKLFLVIDWNKWQTELSFSQFQHGGDGEYRFVTQQLLLGLSRKFSL